jgi:hypothetical protein
MTESTPAGAVTAIAIAEVLRAGLGVTSMGESIVTATGMSWDAGGYSQRNVEYRWRNRALHDALRKVEQIQVNMKFYPDPTSDEKLRDARAGEMYGLDVTT